MTHGGHYLALATDGDGTLLTRCHLAQRTRRALERLRNAGRKLFLVTGERSDELAEFPGVELFDYVVGEDGGALYDPVTRKERVLHDSPPEKLLHALRRKGIQPLKPGRVVVATKCSQEQSVREVLRDLGSDWQVVLNCKDLLIMPRGVNKATGLAAALKAFGLSPQQVVGVGNGENDCDLLNYCGLGVAVASAVPVLKKCAGQVTRGGSGTGFVELVQWMLCCEPSI